MRGGKLVLPLKLPENRSIGLLGLLAIAYAAWFWRYSYIPDLDHGRWLYEVWRSAQGESIYRDIPWQYPPLSLWLYGALVQIFSPSIGGISAISVGIYALICIIGYQWLLRTLPKDVLYSLA